VCRSLVGSDLGRRFPGAGLFGDGLLLIVEHVDGPANLRRTVRFSISDAVMTASAEEEFARLSAAAGFRLLSSILLPRSSAAGKVPV